MWFLGKRKTDGVVGLFGKHPSAGDFLRHNASSPEVLAFDEWVSSAMALGPRLLSDWEQVYRSPRPVAFLFHDQRKECLLGMLTPSHDRSGRLFPLLVFAELPRATLDAIYPVLPHEPFLHATASLLRRSDGMRGEDLMREVQQLPPPSPGSLGRARQEHVGYLDSTVAAKALGRMFAAAPEQQSKALSALKRTAAAARPGGPIPAFAIRCPLGGDAAGNTGFWLEVLRRHAPSLLPNILWTDNSLVIYLSGFSPKALAAVLSPTWEDDSVCDLTTTTAGGTVDLPAPESRLRVLLDL
jgi:type VI secretion system protein ImpM